jgi:hypothetical protein
MSMGFVHDGKKDKSVYFQDGPLDLPRLDLEDQRTVIVFNVCIGTLPVIALDSLTLDERSHKRHKR